MSPDDDDEFVLRSLQFYERAVPSIAADLNAHRSGFRPLDVALNAFDGIELRYQRLGGPSVEHTNLPLAGDLPAALVAMAGAFQDKELTGGDNTWPGCLPGHAHPPDPDVIAGVACWRCPRNGETVSVI